jgi:hypothetical protein
LEAWNKRPEIQEARRKIRKYNIAIGPSGSFRLDDLPAGDYVFIGGFDVRNNVGTSNMLLNQDVTVPEIPNGQSDEPLDLSILTIAIRDAFDAKE